MNETIPGSRPKRRWFRLGLRSLLGAVLVAGLAIAWVARDVRNPFEKLRGDWSRAERDYQDAVFAAKTPEERRKVAAEKSLKPVTFAERCLELAKSQPDTPSELAALCWAVCNVPSSPPGQQAFEILQGGRLDRANPDDLMNSLEAARTASEVNPNPLAPLVLEFARHHLDHPRAARLLAWVCASQFDDDSAEEPKTFAEAANLIADRFADSPDISHLGETLGGIGSGARPWAGKYEKHLRTIIAKNPNRLVRCTASFALASVVQGSGEARQDEAEALYRQFLKDFDGSDRSVKGVEDNLIYSARTEADGIKARGIGKPAPTIVGEDLDGRPIRLDDFRGKVVMVSFWATWCGPCMTLIPHERALLERFKGEPFSIVGVNGDRDPEALRKSLAKVEIPWRSFRDKRAGLGPISEEWKVAGWPTLFLIDHNGLIRNRWVGAPGNDTLDREIGRLVKEAALAK